MNIIARNIKFILFLGLIYLSSSATVYAQLLNVESYRSKVDTSKEFSAQVDLGITATKQQKSVLNATTGTHLYYNRDTWSFLLLQDLQLIRLDRENVISSGYIHGRAAYWLKDQWALEGFTQYQYDIVRGLSARRLEGGGVRLLMTDREKFDVALGAGLMHELERWKVDVQPESAVIRSSKLKSTNYVSALYHVNNNLTFRLISYYQAPFDSFFQPRLITDSQLDFKINEHLSMSVKWSSTYDYDPVKSVDPWIYTLSNSIVARF